MLWDQLPPWLQPFEGAHAFHTAAFEVEGEIVGFQSKLPSSLFGSAHRFAMFGLFLLFLGIGTWGLRGSSLTRRARFARALSVLAPLVCIVVAGTRMGIGLAIVGMMLLAIEPILTARRGFLVKRVQLRRILACLVLGGALFGMLQAFSDTGRFFLHSAGEDATSHWEQFTRGQLPFVLKEAAWLGFGTGTLSQGLAYVSGGRESVDFASRESEGVGVEYGLAKVAWELGVV